MEPQENQALPTGTEVAETAAPVEQAVEVAAGEEKPTENVKNFWERLDDVFRQNEQMKERMDELVSQFPDFQRTARIGDSALFQPSRISINSKDSIQTLIIQPSDMVFNVRTQQEYFNTFRVRLQKSCVNVKSVQLLSAIIPVPQNSFPSNEDYFFYYKIPTVEDSNTGAWSSGTDYQLYDIVTDTGNYYYLIRDYVFLGAWSSLTQYLKNSVVSYLGNTYWCQVANRNILPNSGRTDPASNTPYWILCPNPLAVSARLNSFFWNLIGAVGVVDTSPNWGVLTSVNGPQYLEKISFSDFDFRPPEYYADPVPAYNRLFPIYQDLVDNLNLAASNPVNATAPNDLVFTMNNLYNKIEVAASQPFATNPHYYLPCGFADPNWKAQFPYIYQPMNVRLGYTVSGALPGLINGDFSPNFNPFTDQGFLSAATEYMFPNPNYASGKTFLTFPCFPDLLYSSSCCVYVDFAGGSTQDSDGQGNLLSVVPLNSTQLGVGFYQNNFNNPLTKIPSVLTEFNVVLKTDKGFPYLLPNRATVLLELALEYK